MKRQKSSCKIEHFCIKIDCHNLSLSLDGRGRGVRVNPVFPHLYTLPVETVSQVGSWFDRLTTNGHGYTLNLNFLAVRPEPFDLPFALSLSKGERFAQDRVCRRAEGVDWVPCLKRGRE